MPPPAPSEASPAGAILRAGVVAFVALAMLAAVVASRTGRPRLARAILFALGGMGLMLVSSVALAFVLVFGFECELSCFVLVPVIAGATLAGLPMGFLGGWQPGRGTRAGWAAVGALGLVIVAARIVGAWALIRFLAWPESIGWWPLLRTLAGILAVFAAGVLVARARPQ